MLKGFKEHIQESIIDIPRQTYATPVFDKADTDSPKLKPSVQKQLLDGIKQFTKFGKIVDTTLIGSILTKQYREDADLDVTILFDIPGTKAEQEKKHEEIREFQWTANAKKVGKSNHIINYFSVIDPAVFARNRRLADGTYDINKNEFIRKPDPGTFNSERYVADFQKRVSEIDVVKGELVRDMIDYEELKNLKSGDIKNLNGIVSKKLAEIKDSISTLIDMGDKVMQDRQDAFDSVLTPDQIRKFGVKNRLPKNVIYKMLEKYHYLKFYKTLVEIMEDGKITPDELKTLSKIKEAKGRHIAFTFGRFNPPTTGHEKLLSKLTSIRADDYRIILSRSEDSSKNPLKLRQKVAAMKRMFPRYASKIVTSRTNIVIDIVTEFYKRKFTDLTMVVGSDRVREFDTLLKKYNDVKSRHGHYDFDSINVVSAGERDPDAEGAQGMSASKMRIAARDNDFRKFIQGLPTSFARSKDAEDLFKQTRKGMNLVASYDPSLNEKVTDLPYRFKVWEKGSKLNDFRVISARDEAHVRKQLGHVKKELIIKKINASYDAGGVVGGQSIGGALRFKPFITASTKEELNNMVLRDRYLTEHIYDIGDIVDDVSNNLTGIIIRRGTNYVTLEDTRGTLHKSWLYDIIETPVYSIDLEKKAKEIKKTKPLEIESYDIGHDYAKHASAMTPGEVGYKQNYKGTTYTPSTFANNLKRIIKKELLPMSKKVELKDIEEWANDKITIDKYKERYGDEWQTKIEETYEKMFSKVIDTSANLIEGRLKDIAIDLMLKDKGGLGDEDFKRKYDKSKEEMKKSLGNPKEVKSFKEFAEIKRDTNEQR